MRFSKNLLLALVVLFSISCRDSDDETNNGMRISPEGNYYSLDAGSIINFTLSVESREELSRYRVVETINNRKVTVLKDENISGKVYSDWLDYTVPDSLGFGNHQIELLFSTLDVKGNEMKRVKIITVSNSERNLTEFGGNTMYSSISSQFDAYDLLTGSPKYSSDTTSHIQDFTRANPTDSLSKSWTSPISDIKFVRFNSFDYGNATDVTVKTAFETGVKNDTIRNLKADDVILTKVQNNYIAIKLIFVTDLNGNANDKYIFSIKR